MPFRAVAGRRPLLELLARATSRGTLPPSLVFAGPEGVGKRLTAIALAQALNCERPVEYPAMRVEIGGGAPVPVMHVKSGGGASISDMHAESGGGASISDMPMESGGGASISDMHAESGGGASISDMPMESGGGASISDMH